MKGEGLPDGWAHATIADLIGCDGIFTDGDWVESKDQDPGGEVRLIQLADVGDGEFRDRSQRYMTKEASSRLGCTFLQAGDLLIARMPDPLGRACLVPLDLPQPSVTAVDVCIARPAHRGVATPWLMHAINAPQFRTSIAQLQSGSTRSRISRRNLAGLTLKVPPTPEQHRIVAKLDELFSELDAGVATLERAQLKLERYRASVLKAAVEGRVTERWRRENPSSETGQELLRRILVKRGKRWEEEQLAAFEARGKTPPKDWRSRYQEPLGPDATGLPDLPGGWCWATVDQIGAVLGGLTKNAARTQLPHRLPYLRVANVYADELRLETMKEIGVRPEELEQTLLQPGDLLVVEGNGSADQIGRVAVWEGAVDPCVHQNHIIKVRLAPGVASRWVLTWLLSPGGRSVVRDRASSTSGLYNLSVSKVASLPVPLPPESEQREAARMVELMLADAKRTAGATTDGMTLATHLRQSILSAAFHGRLVPQDPNDEPASVLLERIRAEREEAAKTAKPKGKRPRKKADA